MNDIEKLNLMLEGIVKECELKNTDFSISENKDNSVSLMLRSKLVMRLYFQSKPPFLVTSILHCPLVDKCGFKFTKAKSPPNFIKVSIAPLEPNSRDEELIKSIVNKEISIYSEGSFGCCHRYVECSDNLKCTHPDKLYSNSCQYKQNLLNGRIFYGVNANNIKK